MADFASNRQLELICRDPHSSSSSPLIAILVVTQANFPYQTDPFAEADEDTGETKQSQNYIHIRIQRESTLCPFSRDHGRHSPVIIYATSRDKPADLLLWTERNGRKTLTTVQGLPKKFDQKKILKVIKKKFGASQPWRGRQK
jgi:translation initiation factor 1 (eIF-1/SUI1)